MGSVRQTADKVICLIIFVSFVCILAGTKGFVPAGATKGLSDRPLETFDPYAMEFLHVWKPEGSFFCIYMKRHAFFNSLRRGLLQNENTLATYTKSGKQQPKPAAKEDKTLLLRSVFCIILGLAILQQPPFGED